MSVVAGQVQRASILRKINVQAHLARRMQQSIRLDLMRRIGSLTASRSILRREADQGSFERNKTRRDDLLMTKLLG